MNKQTGFPNVVLAHTLYCKFCTSCYAAVAFQTKEDQIQVIGNLKSISMASSKLLLAAKSLSVDPGAPNAKNLLAAAAR